MQLLVSIKLGWLPVSGADGSGYSAPAHLVLDRLRSFLTVVGQWAGV